MSRLSVSRTHLLTWQHQLPNDVIPSFNVNIIYTPACFWSSWNGNTFYPAGSLATSSSIDRRFYTCGSDLLISEPSRRADH